MGKPIKLFPADLKEAARLYEEEKLSFSKIAKIYGMSGTQLRRRLADIGVQTRWHSRTGKNCSAWKGGKYINSKGYVHIWVADDDPMACMRDRNNRVYEHRLVMARHLGRPLLPEEKVHHENGDRQDNNIGNLELWSTSQPPGQRVKDKVQWAKDLLRLYDPDSLKP